MALVVADDKICIPYVTCMTVVGSIFSHETATLSW